MVIKGFNNYDLEGSFVYFLFSKELLYIGETQKITFSRWVQHFYKNGTFSQKIRKHGDPDSDYYDQINLLSVELEIIRTTFPEVRWRVMSQAVEHALHEILQSAKLEMIEAYYEKYEPEIEIFKIVSDTSKTAPRYLPSEDWDFARSYAKDILKNVYSYI